MEGLVRFIKEILGQFFGGFWAIIKGIFGGVIQVFDIPAYVKVFQQYGNDFDGIAWILSILVMIFLIAFLVGLGFCIYFLIRKIIRFKRSFVSQDELLAEVAKLNQEVIKVKTEKEKILGLKVGQIGGRAGDIGSEGTEADNENPIKEGESRFFKLKQIDEEYANYEDPKFNDTISLSEICDMFRNFACSRMGLFYEPRVIRLFIAAFSSSRLVILQGISGTGKTSLPYAWGKFLNNDAQIASVQPSWRDRSELFGYFNEFTKRFNETEVLKKMYEATYTNKVYCTILDEMNIARVEYYFAEMLSILEMPSKDEWVVDLVPSGWPSDPKHVVDGRFKLPENMWYVGTANNDDSTFAISDKVYDRAIPINIDSKGTAFNAPYTSTLNLDYHHLEKMYDEAQLKYKVSEETIKKLDKLDDYVINHFRLAFGNRIVKQLKDFVPAYVGCGGSEIDGIDYVVANKIFRKFESLNLSFIRDEIDGLINYLDENFGKNNMMESKSYLERLQKLIQFISD